MHTKNSARGNVLFLILIAVVLFAALSYAVTQSSRGSGSTDREKKSLEASSLIQKVTLLRTTVQRIMLTQNLSISEVMLCDPVASGVCFISGGTGDMCSSGTSCIFAPGGGNISPSLFQDYHWIFRESGASMIGHGTTQLLASVDLGVNDALLCESIQEGLGFSTTIELDPTNNFVYGDGTSFSGEYDFCISNVVGSNTYYNSYHLLASD